MNAANKSCLFLKFHLKSQRLFGVPMFCSFVFSASLDGVVRVWENETGNCSYSLAGHREPVYTVSYSPDAKFIATGSSDRCVNIWSTQVCEC